MKAAVRLFRCCACATLLLVAACLGPVKGLYPPAGLADTRTVYVTSHGWHTGVVLSNREARPMLKALGAAFPTAQYLEFGWGDAAFYQAPEGTVGLALKAVLWPTPTVMHVVGLYEEPPQAFPTSTVISIRISRKGFRRLAAYINASFEVGKDGRAKRLRQGLYGDSAFYPAKGTYWLLYTCNNWTAEAVRSTGAPITPCYAVTAGNLVYQMRRITQEQGAGALHP